MADIAVDIGNSRIKWGRVSQGKIAASASLAPGDHAAWDRQLDQWQLTGRLRWRVACVSPPCLDGFLPWLNARGDEVGVLTHASELPLVVKVPRPDWVGIDRLLAAVGANVRRASVPNGTEEDVIVVCVGTAITVDLVDAAGAFLGGAILPGPHLMARTLHEHTALLPLLEMIPLRPAVPATATRAAMEAGIYWAMVGGINGLIHEMTAGRTSSSESMNVFVTGGGASLVVGGVQGHAWHCPELILEGICAAEKVP